MRCFFIRMFMIGCYIIFSKKLKRFYIGATHDVLEERVQKHNEHTYGNHRYTAKANDWEEFLFIETSDYKQALKVEKQIKKMKSTAYIVNLTKYPEMILKLQTM